MNTNDLVPVQHQVDRNLAAGWSWCLLGPEQVQELLSSYRDAWRRLGMIHALSQRALIALADHHIDESQSPNAKEILGEIEELSQCV